MSKWITDREPTDNDAPMDYIIVWSDRWNVPFIIDYGDWHKRYPWMPIEKPESYVAPNQAKELQSNNDEVWQYIPIYDQGMWCLWNGKETVGLKQLTDEKHHEKAAKRIAAIYNEVIE